MLDVNIADFIRNHNHITAKNPAKLILNIKMAEFLDDFGSRVLGPDSLSVAVSDLRAWS